MATYPIFAHENGQRIGRGEQLANAVDVARSSRSGEEAVMADAVEAAGQHVQEKAVLAELD
jgi:hypothetical protein